MVHLLRYTVTFTLLILTINVVEQSSLTVAATSNGNANMPVVDESHVPTIMRYYAYSAFYGIVKWSNFSILSSPVRTPNFVWFVSDEHRIYSFRASVKNVSTQANTVCVSTPLETTEPTPPQEEAARCSQPFISPTRVNFTYNPGYNYDTNSTLYVMYVICQPNLIYSFKADDTTGQTDIDWYQIPIRVQFEAPNSGIPVLSLSLIIQQQNSGASPDLLIVSGNGTIFTIDSSTGQHARQQWGSTNTGAGQLLISPTAVIDFFMKSSVNNGLSFTQLYCSTNSSGELFGFVLTYQQQQKQQSTNSSNNSSNNGSSTTTTSNSVPSWTLAWSIQFVGTVDWTTIRIFDAPTNVYYHLTGQNYYDQETVYRLNKEAPYSFRVVRSPFPLDPIEMFYESPIYSRFALVISGGSWPMIHRLDYDTAVCEQLSFSEIPSDSTPILDAANDRIWYVGSTQIAVFKLSSIISSGSFVTLWYYQTVQDLTQNPKLVQYLTWNESTSFGPKFVISGEDDSNALIIFEPTSYYDEYYQVTRYVMDVKVLSSVVAPSCHDLPSPPKYNSSDPHSLQPQCYCDSITGTARSCAYSNTTKKCENAVRKNYLSECSPASDVSGGGSTNSSSFSHSDNTGTVAIISIICSLFLFGSCIFCFCLVSRTAAKQAQRPDVAQQQQQQYQRQVVGGAVAAVQLVQIEVRPTPPARAHQPVVYGDASPIEMMPLSSLSALSALSAPLPPSSASGPSPPGGYQPHSHQLDPHPHHLYAAPLHFASPPASASLAPIGHESPPAYDEHAAFCNQHHHFHYVQTHEGVLHHDEGEGDEDIRNQQEGVHH